jgi:dTDP-4-amino-4,6-dideoxygalactose transaminase
MSIDELEKKLARAEAYGTLPKVLIPVHFSGQSCDMRKVAELAGRHGIIVIEDASHAVGGKYGETTIGCCAFSEMTVFSFHPVKIVTTGEGGVVLTNSKNLFEKLVRLRSHGITRDAELMQESPDGPWYYQQIELGYNYRMTDIQAALGTSQMRRLDEFVDRRRYLADRYMKTLRDMPLILPWQSPDSYSAWHLYVIRIASEKIEKSHLQVFRELRSAGINVNLHYIPVHTQPYYRRLGFQWGDFPQAEKYYREAISIPLYYALTDGEQDFVVETMRRILT